MHKSISISRCPKCGGEGKIWNFENHEEPDFYLCELCNGQNTVNN
jgi:excinuclease UvrABC ATPase subunit